RLGTGVIATALKRGTARQEHVAAAIASMLQLNGKASEIMLRHPVHACTDITGFGLVGHAREMAAASHVTIDINIAQIEFLPGALEYSAQGALAGGLKNNREYFSCAVEYAGPVAPEVDNLLYDPQTSGGLFISAAAESAERLAEELRAAGLPARIVGEVRTRGPKPLAVC
ncbi:MAG: selenide, water dikinase SelD, partial [Acidobacteria bacterium]|nr:selenide, water dikinase SelD [Acidobacteriota bacterium]